jgi:hypothetical protein
VARNGVGSNADDTWSLTRVGPDFAQFEEEVDSALWPRHMLVAFAQNSRPALAGFETGQNFIEPDDII